MTTACSRCGRDLVPLADLARVAVEAEAARRKVRMAIPDALRLGVPVLAASLPCHAGTCTEREP